jgi:hypothetical protein
VYDNGVSAGSRVQKRRCSGLNRRVFSENEQMTMKTTQHTRPFPTRENATSRRRNHYADHLASLLSSLPCKVFATLTTPQSMSEAWWNGSISIWLRALQAHHHLTLAWLRGDEVSYQRHSHLVLIAASPLNCRIAGFHWLNVAGTRNPEHAQIEPYDRTLDGAGYAAKLYGKSNDGVSLGGDLYAFRGILPSRCLTAREMRRFYRIQKQMAPSQSVNPLISARSYSRT